MGFLVLHRKSNETTVLLVPPSDKQQRIVVTHGGYRGLGVAFGFEADQSVEIVRGELEDTWQGRCSKDNGSELLKDEDTATNG